MKNPPEQLLSTHITSSPGPPRLIWDWTRTNGFVIGMVVAVAFGFLLPEPESREGVLHPELLTNIGIAVILFLQGLSLPWEKVKAGLNNWRLLVIIQVFTFVGFPIVGLGLHLLTPYI